jgi:anaerobic magnesium-protoporphyrin IX monomethyl ester cyclase
MVEGGSIARPSEIILIQPRATNHDGFRMPLNLLQLAGGLSSSDFTVKILDFHIHDYTDSELAEVLQNAFLVGISAFTGLQSSEGIRIATRIRSIKSGIPIVWGGYHASLWSEIALESKLVDSVVTGCGEESFRDLADLFLNNGNPGKVIYQGEFIKSIPSPAYDLIDPEKYVDSTLLGKRVLNINTSYGCTNRCSFCAVWRCFSGKWIGKPPEQIMDEIRYLRNKFGIDGLEFSDNAPFIDKNRMLRTAEMLLGENTGIRWMSMARADEISRYSDEELEILAESGFRRVFVGIESGDDEILRRIDKQQSVEGYIDFARKCKKHGIIPDYSFTIGYPPDPEKDLIKTFNLIKSLKKITPSATVMLYRYTPYQNSEYEPSTVLFPASWEGWCESKWSRYSLTESENPWFKINLKRMTDNFETVLNCAYYRDEKIFPQDKPPQILIELLTRLAKLRWNSNWYGFPYDLKIIRKILLAFNSQKNSRTISA